MKKSLVLSIVSAVIFSVAGVAHAATVSSNSIPTSASVDGSLTLSTTLINGETNATATAMNFGALKDVGGTLVSHNDGTGVGFFQMYITANSHSTQYTIKQTGTAMSNGTTTLPAGACVVAPVYVAADNGGQAIPTGASLGTKGSFIATDKVLYTSESAGALRTIQLYYSISNDPGAGATAVVPSNQAGGTYNGTVVISVTA